MLGRALIQTVTEHVEHEPPATAKADEAAVVIEVLDVERLAEWTRWRHGSRSRVAEAGPAGTLAPREVGVVSPSPPSSASVIPIGAGT